MRIGSLHGLTACGLLMASLSAYAGEPLTWERLLGSIQDDPALKAADKKVSLLRKGPASKMWDDLEFRYQADGLGMLEHDFELRLKPAPMGEKQATKAYWKTQENYQNAKRNQDLSDLLYERYELGMRYLCVHKRLELRNQLVAVNQDRIEVLSAFAGSERFNPIDLVDAQSKDADLRAEVLEDLDMLDELTQKARGWIPNFTNMALDSAWLPSVESIQASLERQPPQVDSTYPELAGAWQKYNSSKARLELEGTSDRSIVQYVGLGYKWTIAKKEYEYDSYDNLTSTLRTRDDNSRIIDRWSLGVGLRIPFLDSKGDDQVKRQVDLLERESDYLAEKRNLEHKVSRIREEIGALLQQRSVLLTFIQQVDTGSLFKDFAAQAGSDPLLLLKARESSLQNALRAQKLEQEIYLRYLALLSYSGVLAREDVSNHLSAGLKP